MKHYESHMINTLEHKLEHKEISGSGGYNASRWATRRKSAYSAKRK